MDLPRTLQYLYNEALGDTVQYPEDSIDLDSSDTIPTCTDDTIDDLYTDTMAALSVYLNTLLIDEVGGYSLYSPYTLCLMSNNPDIDQLYYYNEVVSHLAKLMQTAKGIRAVSYSLLSTETTNAVYHALVMLDVSEGTLELFNTCRDKLMNCITTAISA